MKRPGGALIPRLGGLDDADGIPVYRQVYRRLRAAIVGGALPQGARLPSTRQLAAELALSRNTVEVAFEQLRAEGFIERRVGAGSFVAMSRIDRPASVATRTRSSRPSGPALPLSQRGRLVSDAGARAGPAASRTFAPCVPGLRDFPVVLWNRVVARRARLGGGALLETGDPAGYRPLREATAEYLGAARGVQCDWRQVLIVGSTQQALDLVARLVLDPGDEAWIEEPGYLGARAALAAAGARLVPVPVDSEGIVVAEGAALSPRARLAYVTPSHQYPLGVTTTLARRVALLAWAERAGAWIVEDDYDSEFRYDGRPLAAVQGLDRSARVLYTGTFNKVMFPSLRLAYLVVPPALVEQVSAARAVTDGPVATLAQAALADFIGDGHFAAHIRQMRRLYQERRDVLRHELQQRLGSLLAIPRADAGLHLTAFLPRGRDDRPLSEAATRAGLDVPPLSRYYIGRPSRRGLVLNFAGAGADEIVAGVRALARAAVKVVR